ncbi:MULTISPECIES: hypothetical protein [unclassified Streptomyces]|uniref:hypothetical protein n=1 Tax=unclassified Streptomyces TaxID=2593676 RepID=UPI00093EF73A|nr:hypothetical protein [Streptomyces sp. CB01883]OKJ85102.1 hypothetical protein AMK32_11390 [Streptomyces sp. CB01883]
MAEQQQRESGAGDRPVPRDMPDQQAQTDEDRRDAVPDEPDGDGVPDTDEAGSGPRGAPRSGTVHPEHPAPEEPTA